MYNDIKEFVQSQIDSKKESFVDLKDIISRIRIIENLLELTFDNISNIDYTSLLTELSYDGYESDIELLDIIKVTLEGINAGIDLELTSEQKVEYNALIEKLQNFLSEFKNKHENFENQNESTHKLIEECEQTIKSLDNRSLTPNQIELIHNLFEDANLDYEERYDLLISSLKIDINKHNAENIETKKTSIIDLLVSKGVLIKNFTEDELVELSLNVSPGKIRSILGVLEKYIHDKSYTSKAGFLLHLFFNTSQSYLTEFLETILGDVIDYNYLYKHPNLFNSPNDNEEHDILTKLKTMKSCGLKTMDIIKKCPTSLYVGNVHKNKKTLDLYQIKPLIASVFSSSKLADTIDRCIEADILDIATENQSYLSRGPQESIFYALYNARQRNKNSFQGKSSYIPIKERKDKRFEISREITLTKNNFKSNKHQLTKTFDPSELLDRLYSEYKRELLLKSSDALEISEEALTHPYIVKLDTEKEDPYCYTINGNKETGIIISRLKVLRIFSSLLKRDTDPKIALEYAMLHGSILSLEEIEEIRQYAKYITNERNMKV